MLRINKWPGLLTYASPYILPVGASVEQVNAHSGIPGQLTVRGGMGEVTHTCTGSGCTGAAVTGGLHEIWGWSPGSGAADKIFGVNSAGNLVILTSPTIS